MPHQQILASEGLLGGQGVQEVGPLHLILFLLLHSLILSLLTFETGGNQTSK